jgi:DNA-binding response OmpR family regulator
MLIAPNARVGYDGGGDPTQPFPHPRTSNNSVVEQQARHQPFASKELFMATQPSDGDRRPAVPVLVVGRRATGETIRTILAGPSVFADRVAVGGAAAGEGQVWLPEFNVTALTSQKAALDAIRKHPPRLVLVELDRGPQSRQRFCAMVRYRLPAAALYAISGVALSGGFSFDGRIPVPFQPEDLWLAARSVHEELGDNIVVCGPLRLNLAARTVIGPNGQRHLTPKQCALLHYLMLHVGEVVGRAAIMAAIWETDYIGDTRTLDVHIRWLRECIEPDPSNPVYLVTARGKGYLLSV